MIHRLCYLHAITLQETFGAHFIHRDHPGQRLEFDTQLARRSLRTFLYGPCQEARRSCVTTVAENNATVAIRMLRKIFISIEY